MLKNTAAFSIADLIAIFGETTLYNPHENDSFIGVSTDSREVEKGNIFVALKGETFDGHSKIDDAFSNGAGLVIADKHWFKENNQLYSDRKFIVVNDTLKALGMLGNYHRSRFTYPVLAIGGSNGKTTTKEITAHVLAQKFKVLKTFENFNNQIGVPLMLLQMTADYEVAVLEIGTNEPGEIQILSKIIEPTHGLITNIGKEHLERLIDLDGVEMEEAFLFGHLYKSGGTAFINIDDPRLKKYINLIDNKVTFGQEPSADIYGKISLIDGMKPSIKFKCKKRECSAKMKTTGFTTGLNAIAAATVGFSFGLSPEQVREGIESFELSVIHGYGRMTLEKISGFFIINDCYNANPDSMRAAFNTVEKIRSQGKKYVVIGDMRELGKASFDEHKSIVEQASEVGDEVYCTGEEMKHGLSFLPRVRNVTYFPDKEAIAEKLMKTIKPYDYVLVKGSRGMKMEVIIDQIKEHYKRMK